MKTKTIYRKGKMFNETDTHLSNPYWNINIVLVGSSGWLVIITILAIRFRPKLWELKDSKCTIPIKYFWKIVLTSLKFLDGCCTLMVDDIDEIFPIIKFREEQQKSRKILENWLNGDNSNYLFIVIL